MSSLKTSYQFGLEAFDFDCYAEESIEGAFMGKKIHDDENVTILDFVTALRLTVGEFAAQVGEVENLVGHGIPLDVDRVINY